MKDREDIKDVHTQTPGTPNEITNKDHRQRKDASTSTTETVGTSTAAAESQAEENYMKTKKYCEEVIKKYLQGHFSECDVFEREQLLKNTNKNKILIEEPEFEVIDEIDVEQAAGTSRPNNCHLPDKDAEIRDDDPCFTFISNKKLLLDRKPKHMDNPNWIHQNIMIREPISDIPYLHINEQKSQLSSSKTKNKQNSKIDHSGSTMGEGKNKKTPGTSKVKVNKTVATIIPEKVNRYFSIIGLKKTEDKEQNTDSSEETSTVHSIADNKKHSKKKTK